MSLLSVKKVTAFYGPSQALFDINLTISKGEVVALLGRNGMGKSTTIQVICRMLRNSGGRVCFKGNNINAIPSYKAARLGIGLVPEGRRCFPNITVIENLTVASRPGGWDVSAVEQLFPKLAERHHQLASTLSGGEQQMLAIGRALMTNPDLLLLDEATEGLAPVIRREIWTAIAKLKQDSGLAIIVVDKSLKELAIVADRAVVIEKGCSIWMGNFDELTAEITHKYLGV